MKKTLAIITTAMMALSANAQTAEGGISPDMLTKMETSTTLTSADRALTNAIAVNDIDVLAKTRQSLYDFDDHFSVETKKQSITNQKSSGRCWMFSGLNVLRGNFHTRQDSAVINFSQDYLFFYDQLEKANLFLQAIIDNAKDDIESQINSFLFKNPLNDGGTFCGVADLTAKYGVVPAEVCPETYSANNTTRMSRLISRKLREQGLELRKMVAAKKKPADIQKRKTEMLSVVYRMLVLTLGEPVKEFTYAFRDKSGKQLGEPKTYTPQSFYKEVCGDNLQGSYVMIMNDPHRPYHKTYEIPYDRHTYDGQNWVYLNLPMDEIKPLLIASLKDGKKMYTSYDVGKDSDRKRGIGAMDLYDYASLMGTDFPMTKAERIQTFDSGSTHAMTLNAVDIDKNGKTIKWEVENSWGAESCHQGYFIMTDEWFDEYFFRAVIDKKYIPANLMKLWEQKPQMLSIEDPMFSCDD